MKFFDRIQPGDYVITPYKDYPLIATNKKYKVAAVSNDGRLYTVIDDSKSPHEYSSGIFFEADTYWTCILMRIFSQLFYTKLELLLPM